MKTFLYSSGYSYKTKKQSMISALLQEVCRAFRSLPMRFKTKDQGIETEMDASKDFSVLIEY